MNSNGSGNLQVAVHIRPMDTTTVKATAASSRGCNCVPNKVPITHAAMSMVTMIAWGARSMERFDAVFTLTVNL